MIMVPATSYFYDLNFNQMQKKMRATFSEKKVTLLRAAAKQTAHELGMAVAKEAKDIIDAEHSKTGRLAASIGYYDPSYLKGDSDSSEEDAFFQEETRGNVYFVVIGSTVSYATPVLEGFSMDETRIVYLPDEDRFITVHPFTFGGIHALERAQAKVMTTSKTTRIMKKTFNAFERDWNKG